MPRYYFDLLDGDVLAADEEGMELPDLGSVQAEAAKSLADMARDNAADFPPGKRHDMAIEVPDENGPVLQVRFSFEIARLKH